MPIISNETLIPEKFRSSFGPLVERIDDLVKVAIFEALSGGFSDSVPLLVRADYRDAGAHQVFKIGDARIIQQEANNWDRFIQNGPFENHHVVHRKRDPIKIKGSPHSLIVYNFAGRTAQRPSTFKDLYDNSKDAEVLLTHLFEKILRPSSQEVAREPISQTMIDILQISKCDEIRQTVEGWVGNDHTFHNRPKVRIQARELFNPLFFYPFNSSIQPEKRAIETPAGIVHGDLNAKNILFYETEGFQENLRRITVKIPCLIDYAHTGIKPLYTDLAKLESVLKFQLVRIDAVSPEELLQFEDYVLEGLMPSGHLSITDPHLQKLSACIKVLRETASNILQWYEPLGYWLALYKNALVHLRYNASDSQKRYAFLSSALILTRHLAQ